MSEIIDVVPLASRGLPAEQLAWAKEQLGPDPGAWDGYASISDPDTAKEVFGLVGNIHGYSAKVGKDIVTIGTLLVRMKELLPHGQFMACVKAEFGWDRAWAGQLMKVAERFANANSDIHLPSSARVLALLAATSADDDTVQQAAQERWTVAETKRRVGRSGAPRPPQPTEALALSIIRKGEVERHRAALTLAEQAQELDAEAVMDEIHLRQLPKGSVIYGVTADFHRLKDGRWVRLPHAGQIDVIPQRLPAVEPEPVADNDAKVLTLEQAAAALGLAVTSLRTRISPKQLLAKGPLVRNGWRASKAGRGQIRLEQVNE
jgi:hypothetical protein